MVVGVWAGLSVQRLMHTELANALFGVSRVAVPPFNPRRVGSWCPLYRGGRAGVEETRGQGVETTLPTFHHTASLVNTDLAVWMAGGPWGGTWTWQDLDHPWWAVTGYREARPGGADVGDMKRFALSFRSLYRIPPPTAPHTYLHLQNKTTTKDGTCKPEWNETFDFRITSSTPVLKLEVFDQDKGML